MNRTHMTFLASAVAMALIAAACGGNTTDDESTAADVGDTTTTTPPTTTEAPPTTTTEAPDVPDTTTTTTPPTTTTTMPPTQAANWEQIPGTEDCACADGSEFSYWVREADPNKVVFFLDGGGACFSAETCSFTDGTYTVNTRDDNPAEAGGIFDFSNPANPLADYSFVGVPYCTGDLHLGNATTPYSEDLVIRHNGYINATTALDDMVARFPEATEVVVAGSSAGSAGAPLYGGLAADLFPNASITVVADGSGAYPSIPATNALIGGLWGTSTVIPDWPVNEGLLAAEWGLTELFVQAGKHAPRIRFSRFNNAFDSTQVFYAELAGFDHNNVDQLMAQNEADIESEGIQLISYLAPGDGHTILTRDSLYTLEVEGVAVIDWLTAVVAGEEVDDVTCQDCS